MDLKNWQRELHLNFKEFVLYEDNHLLIVNKPPGILSQGDRTGDATILEYGKRYIKRKYAKPGDVFLHAVHRLDRPTSGCIVLGRTSKGVERMTMLIRNKQMQKSYILLTKKMLSSQKGTLRNYIQKLEALRKVKVYEQPRQGAKEAISHYEHLKSAAGCHLYKVTIETGRKHQIRSQFGYEGAPVIGDLRYGYKPANADKSICLHAWELSFEHPVKKEQIQVMSTILNTDQWPVEP